MIDESGGKPSLSALLKYVDFRHSTSKFCPNGFNGCVLVKWFHVVGGSLYVGGIVDVVMAE